MVNNIGGHPWVMVFLLHLCLLFYYLCYIFCTSDPTLLQNIIFQGYQCIVGELGRSDVRLESSDPHQLSFTQLSNPYESSVYKF